MNLGWINRHDILLWFAICFAFLPVRGAFSFCDRMMNDPARNVPLFRSSVAMGLKRSSSLGEESSEEYYQEDDFQKESLPEPTRPPYFTVGMIADIQYAPIPDGYSYSGTPRYYRHALEVARHAAEHFEADQVDLVINLGDTIDGKCQNIVREGGEPVPDGVDPGIMSIDHVIHALSPYKSGPMIHTYGNHCLYNLDRKKLSEKLGIKFIQESCGNLVGCSSQVHKGFRFVVVDTYDVASKTCDDDIRKVS